MALVPFNELMREAEKGHYAVGYFESWNLESLQAVADAAESTRSPVILGFSGIYLPHPARMTRENLRVYAALGLETCRSLSVPSCLLFNESPYFDWVAEAIDLGFGLVMYTEEQVSEQEQVERVRAIVEKAHRKGVAVEGELSPLPGAGGELLIAPETNSLDDPEVARSFVEQTQVDAFAVNIGQAHRHGRSKVQLDLARLKELREKIAVPLVLHGATSIAQADLKDAIQVGVRKINVGSVLKSSFFEAMRSACPNVNDEYNPYEVVGSGFEKDVLTHARIALQKKIEELMNLFGSALRA
ncbi:MAG TPA: class II fructose-bisphosphate aldolase [Terriglobia bacterium]|nr:class II fructose-bisphosphate aldolase [Terriglobia bacterium]